MADKKISQLTGASTPLAGTEVLPIVQGGTTVKVSVADITAGRAVSAASLTPSGSTIPTNGFYLPSADTVGIATASTLRGVVSSTGNFGFGVSTPQYRMDVQNQSAINSFQASFGAVMGAGSWTGIHIGYKEPNNTTYRKGAIAFETVDNDARGTIHILNNGAASAASATLTDSKLSVAYGGDVTVPIGNVVIGTAGKGIDFSANGGDVLKQYDEGTYTPVFTASSSNPTVTYGLQRGKYVRVGNTVTVSVFITWSALSGGSGDLQISLPFAGESSVGAGAAGAIADLTGFTFAAGRTFCSVRPNANVLYATFPQSGSAVSTSNTTVAQTASSGLIVFSCTYLV